MIWVGKNLAEQDVTSCIYDARDDDSLFPAHRRSLRELIGLSVSA